MVSKYVAAMRIARALALPLLTTLVAAVFAAPATADPATEPPPVFGTDWDDPRTATPPVKVPDTKKCTTQIVDAQFKDFEPAVSSYTPPAGCKGPWSKVVLRLDGSVKGRQFDRIGQLDLGDVTIFRLSTPEPSPDGISWQVEKDVTAYVPLLKRPQEVKMWIGNVVNETYTGIFDVDVHLDFYKTGRHAPAAKTADQVLPLASRVQEGGDTVGTLTVPRNTERLLGEVYATGSGGGCEEFWDTSAPASTGYSCPDGLPYREVDVLIDGRVAGVALPYPHIYTGGWSNPFLWYAVPAPRAFDIRTLRYDLTPFVGELTDGAAHEVRLRAVGVPEGQAGWSLLPNFQVWQDHGSRRVRGAVTSYAAPEAVLDSTVTGAPGEAGRVEVAASRRFAVSGYVDTSRGRVRTSVTRELTNDSTHHWAAGESHDELDSTWIDTATSVADRRGSAPVTRTARLTYSKQGWIDFTPHATIPDAYDVLTDLDLADRSRETVKIGRDTIADRKYDDTFDGWASWIYGVPRDQREAKADTTQRLRLTGDPSYSCYDRELRAVQGFFVRDLLGC